MLTRQKVILALLSGAGKPLTLTAFVKLVFLLRHESTLKDCPSFYDFVPYKYGPFSFTLYRELANLRRDGFVSSDQESVVLRENTAALARDKARELPVAIQGEVNRVLRSHGQKSSATLLKDVYTQYPWYAAKSELADLRPSPPAPTANATPAVRTAGYEGESVDSFFNRLLRRGIQLIIDVRANPISRRYGFSKSRLKEIGARLGFRYLHLPSLGIPRKWRADLTDFNSYQRLMSRYEQEMLPNLGKEVREVGRTMNETPAVLVCLEKDVRCCHRGRLALAVSRETGLDVDHL